MNKIEFDFICGGFSPVMFWITIRKLKAQSVWAVEEFFRFSDRGKRFLFDHTVHIDLQSHTATYSVGTISSFFRGKLQNIHYLESSSISFEKVINSS